MCYLTHFVTTWSVQIIVRDFHVYLLLFVISMCREWHAWPSRQISDLSDYNWLSMSRSIFSINVLFIAPVGYFSDRFLFVFKWISMSCPIDPEIFRQFHRYLTMFCHVLFLVSIWQSHSQRKSWFVFCCVWGLDLVQSIYAIVIYGHYIAVSWVFVEL